MDINSYQLKHRFVAFGCTKLLAGQYSNLIMFWVRHSGKEWTCQRLKEIKDYCLHYMYYMESKLKLDWIAKDPDGKISGPFRNLCVRYDGISVKTRSRILNMLRSYTIMISDKVTDNQLSKFINSVVNPKPCFLDSQQYWDHHKDYLTDCLPPVESSLLSKRFINFLIDVDYPNLDYTTWSENRYKPSLRNVAKTIPETEELMEELIISYKSSILNHCFHNMPRWMYDFRFEPKHLIKGSIPKETYNLLRNCTDYHLNLRDRIKIENQGVIKHAGKISLLQEPGYKLRAVANPYRIFQVILDPMKEFLFKILTILPWDATYNQDKFDDQFITDLSNGTTLYSVDLSDATNTFPLTFQRDLFLKILYKIRSLSEEQVKYGSLDKKNFYSIQVSIDILEASMHVFEQTSIAPWYLNNDIPDLSWKKGQPLGLGPSFPLFAFSHGNLLYSLCSEIGLDPLNNFFILGDDIVIRDKVLFEKYKGFLDILGCDISEHKSLTSENVAEFAGKIIDKSKSYHLYKWRFGDENNFVQLIKNFGDKIIDSFPKHIRSVATIVSPIPDVTPIGCGQNPQGKTFLERIKGYEHLLTIVDVTDGVVRAKRGITPEMATEFFIRYSDFSKELINDLYLNEILRDPPTTVEESISLIDSEYTEYKDFIILTFRIMNLLATPEEKAIHLENSTMAFIRGTCYNFPSDVHRKIVHQFEIENNLTISKVKRPSFLDQVKNLLNL